MKGSEYLFAAYAATWIIHIAYIATIVSRYAKLKKERKEDLGRAGLGS
jgi:CcmD family protein